MFTYFHLKKLRYEKGQMIPVFVVVLVAIIIMAMVTVNLSKVALMRTDVSNAADAGAIAGGSMMAGVFNQQAVMNAQMKADFWMGYASITTSLAVALGMTMVAAGMCCSMVGTPAYVGLLRATQWTLKGITLAIYGFSEAQYLFYKNMKKEATKGRKEAIKGAYRYAYLNSGIGNKLISSSILRAAMGGNLRGSPTNYSDAFNLFLKTDLVQIPVYAWTDGQHRVHLVEVYAHTQSVGNYRIKVSTMPIALMMTRLYGAQTLITEMIMWAPSCLVPGVGCGIAWGNVDLIAINFAGIVAGMLPGRVSSAVGGGLVYIFDWVDDIKHNRKFTVQTSQFHGPKRYGENFTLWRMSYPLTTSFCRTDFRGNGSISPPKPRHDASINLLW
ncbi:MAG: hypothetical protein KBA46_01230 [Candidatus Omnitrophica bacterium]|nr:hypothetical protein [Candidatus Omnitrophota bacterium]